MLSKDQTEPPKGAPFFLFLADICENIITDSSVELSNIDL